MHTERIHQIAESLIAARQDRRRLDPADFPSAPADRNECYAIQQQVLAAFGSAGAFKTGRNRPGDEPIMAPILSETVRASGAAFARDELFVVGIELEIAFRINSALPDPATPDFAEMARACVSPLPAIEVVDTRLVDPDAAGDMWKLADNQINGGLVFGEAVADWHDLDLTGGDIDLTVGGTSRFSGAHDVPGGDAFDVFCAFAAIVGDHCGGLRPGHIVTTGSLMGLLYIEPGQKVSGAIAGLGPVEVTFN